MLLRLPGILAHLVVVATVAGMAGVDGGEHFRGGRSSGTCGFGVVVHGRVTDVYYVLLVRCGARCRAQ